MKQGKQWTLATDFQTENGKTYLDMVHLIQGPDLTKTEANKGEKQRERKKAFSKMMVSY